MLDLAVSGAIFLHSYLMHSVASFLDSLKELDLLNQRFNKSFWFVSRMS
jgi:hypothetical protein